MNAKSFSLVVALLGVVIISSVGFAQSEDSQSLSSAMAHATCKIDFTVLLINSTTSKVPSQVLTDDSGKLSQDKMSLQTFVANNDVDGFRAYIHNTFDADLKKTRDDISDVRKNLTNTTKQMLEQSYKTLRASFEGCSLDSLKKHGDSVVEKDNKILGRYQAKADNLKSRGIDTAGLNAIISDAKAQIVTPLQNAINNATNNSQVHSALKQYCLFDSCKNGINFHLGAKFEIEKLNEILVFAKINNTNTTVANKITEAQNYLASAKSVLDSAGTSQLTAQQEQQIWGSIRSAEKDLKEVLAAIKLRIKINKDGRR